MDINIYKEKISHGNALFPMAVHFTQTSGDGYEKLYCHWHEEFEFLIVTEGGAEFHVGTRTFQVLAGEAVFIHPNQLHSATAIKHLCCDFFAVVINPSLMQSSFVDVIQQKYIDPVLNRTNRFPDHLTKDTEWGGRVIALLYLIKDLFRCHESGYELLIKASMFEIWYLMELHSDNVNGATVRNNDYRVTKIKSILNYIHQNSCHEIALADLSAYAHLSQGQFCRFFKQMVKMSAINYINYYRISKSVSLLEKSDRKISDIACSVGFNNIAYFNKIFRKFMHASPTEYKQAHHD